MKTLFVAKKDSERRSKRIVLRVTADEEAKVRAAADARKMDVAEFARRAMLGRRADVDHITDAVLALSSITREIRALHAAMVERGLAPPNEALLPVILEARAAILKVADSNAMRRA